MPPPAKPLSMEERIVFLEKQLQHKDQQLSKHAMDFNTRIVRYCANRFLRTGTTIKHQEPARLEKVIQLIMRENSYFQRFHGGWPIRDFIKQYLLNNSDNYKRAMRKERAAEAKDDENWEDEDDDMSVEEEVGDDTVDSEEEEDIVIGDDEDVDEEPDNVEEPAEYEELDEDALEDILDLEDDGEENGAKMVWSPAPSTPINAKKSKENIAPKPPLPANRPQPKPLYKKKVTEAPASPSPKKRKAPDSASEPAPQPAKKSKIILSPIPVSCPAEGCKDLVPNPVPRSIVQLFRQRQELIDADGATAAACNELTAEICKAIRAEDERSRCLAEAKTIGWPLNINFDTLAPRITALSHEINRLSSSSISLNKSPVWRAFLKRIDYKVWAFSRASSRFPSAQLGCGYYGPKGLEIIKHALKYIQKEEDEDEDSIENCLFATLSGLIDTPNNWDEYDDDSNLISPNKFMKFILIPHVAASLIAEDLEIELREAVDILELSEQYGFLFNADPPPKVDIAVSPVYAQQAPPRLRKKLTLLPPKQKTITLEDFPPPPPPKSKSKKAQIVGKPKAASPIKKPPSKPKPVQKPSSKSGAAPAKAPKSSSKPPTKLVSQPKPTLRSTTRQTAPRCRPRVTGRILREHQRPDDVTLFGPGMGDKGFHQQGRIHRLLHRFGAYPGGSDRLQVVLVKRRGRLKSSRRIAHRTKLLGPPYDVRRQTHTPRGDISLSANRPVHTALIALRVSIPSFGTSPASDADRECPILPLPIRDTYYTQCTVYHSAQSSTTTHPASLHPHTSLRHRRAANPASHDQRQTVYFTFSLHQHKLRPPSSALYFPRWYTADEKKTRGGAVYVYALFPLVHRFFAFSGRLQKLLRFLPHGATPLMEERHAQVSNSTATVGIGEQTSRRVM
ncbi:hypothetical protein B0H16DRAFT_1792704 [Mycena metata]|uniref:Restriction of telomere capping protein 4 n=1 Tax=Mycena metata TaxID=1033252 RepID=A0AAD7HHG0_9AGAR|nr:hypothetical protein B0H16DRAFT_1792704 [Mycena metata]